MANGLVEYRRFLPDSRSIGWQLQGNQYRLFGESARGTALGLQPSQLSNLSAEWFTFNPAQSLIGCMNLGKRASGEGVFGDTFRHQYRQLPAAVTNAEVLELLIAETRRLAKVIA